MATDHETWLTLTQEEALEPDLPICDPHHHLWDYPNNRYLLDELLQDLGGGHRVTQTVFVECVSMYRKDGPEEMKPGRGDRICAGHRRPECEWKTTDRPRSPPESSVWPISLSVQRSSRSSKRIWRPAATGFVGSGTPQAGIRMRRSEMRIRIRRKDSCWTRPSGKGLPVYTSLA